MTPPEGPSLGISGLKPILEFLAGTSAFVVLMGVPASVHQYASNGIPLPLLTYRRALEAGVVPAVIAALFIVYLQWVKRRSVDRCVLALPTTARRTFRTPLLAVPAFPFVLPAFLLIFTALAVMYGHLCWVVGWLALRPALWVFPSLVVSGVGTAGIGLGSVGLFVSIGLVVSRRHRNAQRAANEPQLGQSFGVPAGSRAARARSNARRDRREEFLERWVNPGSVQEARNSVLFSYFVCPILMLGVLVAVRRGVTVLGLHWMDPIDDDVLVAAGVYMGIAYSHLLSVSATARVASALNEREGEGAARLQSASYVAFLAASIVVYSVYLYPITPRYLGGGGRTNLVRLVLDPKMSADPWIASLGISGEGVVTLPVVEIVDRTSTETIICSGSQGGRACAAVPNSGLVSMGWSAGTAR